MSKETRARKRAYIERILGQVARDIRSIEASPARRAGSQLASALGVEHPRHELRADLARSIITERGFTNTLKSEGLHGATSVARNLQLFGGVALRDLIAQKRTLETQLRQMA